jgi:hypothetical protein
MRKHWKRFLTMTKYGRGSDSRPQPDCSKSSQVTLGHSVHHEETKSTKQVSRKACSSGSSSLRGFKLSPCCVLI